MYNKSNVLLPFIAQKTTTTQANTVHMICFDPGVSLNRCQSGRKMNKNLRFVFKRAFTKTNNRLQACTVDLALTVLKSAKY